MLLFVAALVVIPILTDHDQAAEEETLFAHRTRAAAAAAAGQMVGRDQYVISSLAWLVFQGRLFLVPMAVMAATGGLLLSNPLTSTK